jgi:hypothetical protein
VSAFFYVVLSCAGTDLATSRSPIQEVLPNAQKQIQKFQKSNSESQQARGPTLMMMMMMMDIVIKYHST